MIKVAITGGIACGKSVLLDHLILSNYVVYSSDSIAHDVLRCEGKEEVIPTPYRKAPPCQAFLYRSYKTSWQAPTKGEVPLKYL